MQVLDVSGGSLGGRRCTLCSGHATHFARSRCHLPLAAPEITDHSRLKPIRTSPKNICDYKIQLNLKCPPLSLALSLFHLLSLSLCHPTSPFLGEKLIYGRCSTCGLCSCISCGNSLWTIAAEPYQDLIAINYCLFLFVLCNIGK